MKRHFATDIRGGGSVLECVSATALVLVVALALGQLGNDVRARIVGGADSNPKTRSQDATHAFDWHVAAPVPANPVEPYAQSGCEDGFVQGAMRAFVNGEGEVVGDLFGVKDADLKAWFWDRSADQVLGDARRAVTNAAPGLVAAAPGILVSAGISAAAYVTRDPAAAARTALNVLFVDPLRNAGRMAIDG